jgi:hypothetical protein
MGVLSRKDGIAPLNAGLCIHVGSMQGVHELQQLVMMPLPPQLCIYVMLAASISSTCDFGQTVGGTYGCVEL